MITLYTFGPAFGLPDMSPFVTKAEMLLKLAGLDYRTDPNGFNKAPKGKLPYIDDDGEVIADSTFIRRHIERKYGIDFDKGLDAEQRATAWAFERMFEDHAYWTFLHARWVDQGNFDRGPRVYFERMPMPMRLIVPRIARRQLKAQIMGQGIGRHSDAEIVELGTRSLDAAAAFLGQKTYMMGEELSGLDATAFAFLAGALCPIFETPLRTAAERHDNIKAYVGRITERFYPDYGELLQWTA
ncbi:glutathione S-transferase family protein [Methyloceanibacter sp. wino2]|uniref:glutathione S-transferase family protein n=1 Tax=Methyloceanibacter sp. wino2 TaxID=2170729 RepID=UPI000D3E753A|nr:glutathione S-transferase family protein [Methyloceanibacter sp. wino2]